MSGFIITEGEPSQPGLYVTYVNGPSDYAAKRIFLIWSSGKWFYPSSDQIYRDHIYGFIGPIPVLSFEQ